MAELGLCGDCIYWQQNDARPHLGECRRYPPTVTEGAVSHHGVWPETREDAGCGEFDDGRPFT